MSDSQRCKGLTLPDLNGNNIVTAIVGWFAFDGGQVPSKTSQHMLQAYDYSSRPYFGETRHPNRQLNKVGVVGVWRQRDSQEEMKRVICIRRRYASSPTEDIYSSSSGRRNADRRDLPSSASEREAPREVACHVTSIGVTLDERVSDFEKASELDAGISQSSAKDVLSKSLADNADPNVGCKFAAFDVVSAVSSIDTWVLGEKAEPRNQSHGQEKAASSRRDSSMHYQSTVFTLYAS